MEKKYVLAVDQSTQGTKAILFDVNGDLVCRTDLPHRQLINEKGWVSHDLSEIYSNTIQVVKNLWKKPESRKKRSRVSESVIREKHPQRGAAAQASLWHLPLYGSAPELPRSVSGSKQT